MVIGKDLPEPHDIGRGGRFIEADASGRTVEFPQIHASVAGSDRQGRRLLIGLHGQRVEAPAVPQVEPQLLKAGGQRRCQAGDPVGDRGEPLRPVIDGVHRCHHGGQDLCGADVRSRLFTADVLLTGLERQSIGRLARSIDADPDQSTGQ